MRQIIKDFVAMCAVLLPYEEPVYEFGSYQVQGQELFGDLRPYFPGKSYVGCDMRMGPGVDRILDLQQIDLPDESVGLVLSLDTLDHVEDPRLALKEIHRILKPNGIVVISSFLNFPIYDSQTDYWRFTPAAFASMMKPFDLVYTDYAGEEIFPHTVVGIGIKGNSLLEHNKKLLQHYLSVWRAESYHQR